MPVWVTNLNLREGKTVHAADSLDGCTLDQNAMLQITILCGLLVGIYKSLVCCEEIDGWARGTIHAMARRSNEHPAISASMSLEVVFKVLSAFRPVQMSKERLASTAQKGDTIKWARTDYCPGSDRKTQLGAIAAVVPSSVTATATTYVR